MRGLMATLLGAALGQGTFLATVACLADGWLHQQTDAAAFHQRGQSPDGRARFPDRVREQRCPPRTHRRATCRLLDSSPARTSTCAIAPRPSASDRNVTGRSRSAKATCATSSLVRRFEAVFSMREPLIEGADEEDQPTWNIWNTTRRRGSCRVTQSDIVAEKATTSPRTTSPTDASCQLDAQRSARDPARRGQAAVRAQDEDRRSRLRAARDERRGTGLPPDLVQPEHDLIRRARRRRIVFSRWRTPAEQRDQLYTVRPDGSQLELLYGPEPRYRQPMAPRCTSSTAPAGSAAAGPRTAVRAPDLGGQLLEIDIEHYVEIVPATLPNRGA